MKNTKGILAFMILSLFVVVGCSKKGSEGSGRERILIVQIREKGKASEVKVIKEALKKGGFIVLNTNVAVKIDHNFGEKYAVVDSKGKFFIAPALLNFVADRGWKLRQVFSINFNPENIEYYFVKSE